MVRSVIAVAVGYLICASLLMGGVLSLFSDAGAEAEIAPLLASKAVAAILLAVLLGGGVAGLISGRHPGGHGAVVGALTAAVAAYSLVNGADAEPTWFSLGVAGLAIPTGWVAGLLAQNIKSRK